ncbi:unnamed protein product [Urochloa humidicola]
MMVFSDDDDLTQWWEEEDEYESESESDHDDNDDLLAILLLADMDHERCKKKRRGSILGREVVPRNMPSGHLRIFADYFVEPPVYNAKKFRRRFRMSTDLFLRIVDGVATHDDYFKQKPNASGLLGATALQKVFGPFRMMAYDVPADSLDDVVRMAESTTLESFHHFVRAVVEVFGEQYLRAPTVEDTARLMAMNTRRGWPGMLGCIDCMHWKWKNCPTAWKGQYSGHVDGPTMILEAVASEDLWIWHSFFGLPGSLNDINVLHRSPLFQRLKEGTAPPMDSQWVLELEVNSTPI